MALFVDWSVVEIGDLCEDFLFFMSLVLLLVSNILKSRFFTNALCFLYVFYIALETTSYIAISTNFTSSYMFLLIESNQRELSEFVSSYINFKIILFLILMGISFLIIKKIKFENKNFVKQGLGIFIFLGIIAALKFTGLIEKNAYYNTVRGVYGYFDLQNSVNFNSKLSKEDIKVSSNNEVLVFVLGESTTRRHMQLYGYSRETTPLLNSIEDRLFVYDNVISTDVFTLKVVPKMITSLDETNTRTTVTSLVQVFNNAGFKTFWLANQRPISYHDNAINKIASYCYDHKFYNYKDDVYTNILDEVVLSDYSKILKEPGKKVIFIKLLGTHFNYSKRYPKSFAKFLSDEKSNKEDKLTNQYDNAVLYNDFIVYTLIKELENTNTKSTLLYLSDHGENVYHEGTDFFGRNEQRLTKSMFEIPFFVWTSKTFDFPEAFQYKRKRAFMTDHIYESVSHLFGVKHKDMDFTRSIFSKNFKKRKRIIVNGIDFDNSF
ncbi:sulfatase-like hydrolase/transferase [Flavobacteriaceae bacterium GSB9]|nr:sulfatase-like hydrolase/transferase [Flavobacteriaceae bacterium GSB9]